MICVVLLTRDCVRASPVPPYPARGPHSPQTARSGSARSLASRPRSTSRGTFVQLINAPVLPSRDCVMCPACPCIYRTVARQYIARMRPLPVSTSAREPCDCRSERAVASAPSVQLYRLEPRPLPRCSLLLNPTPTRPNLARDLAVLSIAGVPSPPAPNHASPPPARRIGGSGKYCAARRAAAA